MWKVLTHENSATPQIKFQLRCREKDLSTIFLCGYVLRLLGRRIKDCDLYQWATLVGQTFLNHSWYNLLIESWNRPRGGLETEVHEVDLHLQIFFHRKTILRGKTGFFCRWPCLKSMNPSWSHDQKMPRLSLYDFLLKDEGWTMKVCILQWWNACSSKGAGRSFWFFLFFSPEHWKPANKIMKTNGVGASVFTGRFPRIVFVRAASRRKRRLLSKRRALVVLQKATKCKWCVFCGESWRSIRQ